MCKPRLERDPAPVRSFARRGLFPLLVASPTSSPNLENGDDDGVYEQQSVRVRAIEITGEPQDVVQLIEENLRSLEGYR